MITIGTRFDSRVEPRTLGYRLTGPRPSGVRYVCINCTLLICPNTCRDVSREKRIIRQRKDCNAAAATDEVRTSSG